MWSLFKTFIILLLLTVICQLSILILKLLMPLIFFFFFCIADTYSKLWYYARVWVVTVSLIFFRLWTSISDLCTCKVFHCFTWFTLSWTVRGRLISGVFFPVYFVIIHVCNILCCQPAVLICEPENTEAKQFFSTSWRKGGR